ncbi:cytochrome P450 [Nocardia terpenica]|uniref:cytochrome P450 n=1 Tax=Nocardia terpenica TaxID=455432 RepID=UPI002FDF735F
MQCEEIPAAALVLAAAFEDDPVMCHLWPNPRQRRWALPRYFRTVMAHHHVCGGGVEVATTESGEIAGVAVWDPPGRWDTTTGEFTRSAVPLALAFGHRIPVALRTRQRFDDVHPHEPHWYLCHLAVLPTFQGQGIGTNLLRARCDRCDAAEESAYLVCTRRSNVALYEAAGFATMTTVQLELPDGTPLWPMWRDPTPSTTTPLCGRWPCSRPAGRTAAVVSSEYRCASGRRGRTPRRRWRMMGSMSTPSRTAAARSLPHPRGRVPLLGDVLTLDLARPTQQAVRDARKLGGLFERRIFGAPVVIVSDAELIAQVNDESLWAKHVGAILKPLREIAGPGLFTAFNNEAAWGASHRVLVRGFRAEAMHGYHSTMMAVVDELLDYWRSRPGEWIDVVDDTQQMALEIIGRAGFGYGFGGFDERGPFGPRLRRGLTYLNRAVNLPTIVKSTVLRRQTVQHQRDIEFLHQVIDDIVAARRAAPEPRRDDLLDLMLHTPDPATDRVLTDDVIHAQCITMLVAGHETTAAALSFALHALAHHPGIADRARAEIDATLPPAGSSIGYDDIARLRYLRRVIDETLRLWPPAPGHFREARQPVTLGGHDFARGDWVFVLTLAAHRDPAAWSGDAEQFDPDRWAPDRLRQLGTHIYQPWGIGPRACIGRVFALHELTLALAQILRAFDLHPEPGYELLINEQITIKPSGLRLQLTPRG